MRYNRFDDGFPPYIPVARRRLLAARELEAMEKKSFRAAPVELVGKKIATTFWGKAWCDNLERYSDYSNRLPRGRTYVRNGSVVHLELADGAIRAAVSGSELYWIDIKITAVTAPRWAALCADCAGEIDSLVELLRGRFSKGVMTRLCEQGGGLFPSPTEIRFSCTCPDSASMCKHVAATLYGVGARLDRTPELLFKLRHVDGADLIAKAGTNISKSLPAPTEEKLLVSDDLASLFGLEIAPSVDETPAPKAAPKAPKRAPAKKKEQKPRQKMATEKAPSTLMEKLRERARRGQGI